MTETQTVAGLLAMIGLGTLLRSVKNGLKLDSFIAAFDEWKKGFLSLDQERHRELERRIENLEAHDR